MNEPNTAAIEAAVEMPAEQKNKLWMEWVRSLGRENQLLENTAFFKGLNAGYQKGYEAAKAANDLALQLAYESGKEAAEGNGWVRCEDRLPEGYGLYNVTWFNIVEFITCSAIFAEGRWWNDDGEAFPREVIAWMPLPEYTGE